MGKTTRKLRKDNRMGTKGREIVELDVEELIKRLNSALADEWLAVYQYWAGAKIIKGPMAGAVEAELLEHAAEEKEHADMLAARIVTLGGTPLINPKQWYEVTNCGYEEPTSDFVMDLLKQNIKGEQCAIEVYKGLLDFIGSKDPVTFHIIIEILEDEVDHEEELQTLEENFQYMLEHMK
jgi:bacterioferritin